ncbi:hypothetical protein [Gaiella sp.]|uniref:hypothetical protein n=1 Tax=Gaiella sp. TaxID=2663207 RepID=UPI00326720AD
MSMRTATWLASGLVLATVVILAAWVSLLVLNARSGLTGDVFLYSSIFPNLAPAAAFVAVGFLVATRKPENPIGWLLLVTGPVTGLPMLATQYAAYALLAGHDALPGARAIAISLNGFWIPGLFVLLLLALLFPTGHLPSRRWRFVVWLSVISLTLLFLVAHLAPLDPPFTEVNNPFETESSAIEAVALLVAAVGGLLASAIAVCTSVVVRFRRSTGDEREQLKWFVFAAAILPLGPVVHLLAETFAPGAVNAVESGYSLAIALIPIAIGVAILKYRLYEIDRIISRALVYGSMTVILLAVYVGLVLAGQALFSSFAGGSNLAVAASTLIVAAIFLPVRSRVQRFVDRRFYRSRYDAQRTLEAFGGRLREQVELDGLVTDLRGVVAESMQPTHTSVWLRSRLSR